MELKVWVEGIQRIVCGVNDTTTCQDVVFALAHATGKVGRFTLVERWRNNERLLAPQEYPLKILMKWGEYSNDIQFILRQSDTSNNTKQSPQSLAANTKTPAQTGHGAPGAGERAGGGGSPARGSASPAGNPVGVVRGVPQRALDSDAPKDVPPYREPPPPYRSPPPPAAHRKSPAALAAPPASAAPAVPPDVGPEPVSYNSQYRELVSLVNHQREKLSNQQADLIKFDAEIGYWENKGREQDRQVELLQQQISSADNQLRISSEQVQALSYMEEESEMVKQKEKWIRSETALLRCKLAECEAELQQCRNKIRRLLDELQSCHHDSRGTTERSMLAEMESLQTQIQHAKHATDLNHLTAETLKREVGMLESAIMEKKRQVEQLVQEMKEANLQSLAGSTDELRHLLDGSCKAGSARRIIGSPRQLENAAPTNKNPHGVWV